MKCEVICKIHVVIMRPFENRGNLIREGALSSLSVSFNIEEVLICHQAFDASLFDGTVFLVELKLSRVNGPFRKKK